MHLLRVDIADDIITIKSQGDWDIYSAKEIEESLLKIAKKIKKIDKKIIWNLCDINSFDTTGVLLFKKYYKLFKQTHKIRPIGYTTKQIRMYKLVKIDIYIKQQPKNIFYKIGKDSTHKLKEFNEFLLFVGYTTMALLNYIIHPSNIRFKEIVYYIQKSGVNAIFIIALTSFLVGLVIAYQSAVQLAKFGGDIFIVDMIGISITRELAPMITAIVIAGRSGSSYTAQIGAMKITEEINAMKTMGFDPYYFLVLPRVIALIISMPLLIFFADIMGIFGGMIVAYTELEITFVQFIARLQYSLGIEHLLIGLVKAPFFAIIIALIGCFRGFQISQNTESIGKYTTISVVNSIFFVIASDALFSIFFTQIGI